MSGFEQYTLADAPEASRQLLQQVQRATGFIPNLYATFAESPALLEGELALDASLDKGTLTPVFLAAGYTKAQLLEVVGHVAAKTISNYIHALTHAPLDAAFQAQQWDTHQFQSA